jgi:glycolate oxidase
VLPEVVAAVGDRATIIVDGGFMRGTDVVKAIARGAHAVGIGRLAGLALGAAGEPGLVRALEILEEEVRICLGLLGACGLAELSPAYLYAGAEPVRPAHVTSAFPLLEAGY